MITRLKRLAVIVCGATFFSSLTLAKAQPYIYPNQGQSPQQEQFDKGQCYSWAVQQTGFDPGESSGGFVFLQGCRLRRAACSAEPLAVRRLGRSAAPLAGMQGRGAAIGAGVGALFGGLRRARERRERGAGHAILHGAAAGRHVPGAEQL